MSNKITFTGRVSVVLPVESGTSSSGKSWSKQTIVITEEDVQYPGSIAVTLFKPELVGTVAAGETITAHLSVQATEYNGKYYNNISAWKIEHVGSAAPAPYTGAHNNTPSGNTANSYPAAPNAPQPTPQPAGGQDDLPF